MLSGLILPVASAVYVCGTGVRRWRLPASPDSLIPISFHQKEALVGDGRGRCKLTSDVNTVAAALRVGDS